MHKFENSSALAHCSYEDGCLKIKFHSGEKEHEFHDVPEEIFEGLKAADSPGKFFHSKIRNKFKTKNG